MYRRIWCCITLPAQGMAFTSTSSALITLHWLTGTQILSIRKALPLQIHPNKELAAQLHKKDPEKFADPNHKAEIAVALSKFEIFVGWKPSEDIHILLEQLEALRRFLPDNIITFTNETLRAVTRAMLEASEEVVADTQEKLGSLDKDAYGRHSYILELLQRLQKQYSKENAGSLVALVCMNFMVLSPGDAVYIPADGMHACLSGDIVECMARSNNVINTGFCPRADRDSIELFSNTMTFKSHDPKEALLPSKPSNKWKHGKTVVYAPPMSEFNMFVTNLAKDETEVSLHASLDPRPPT